MKPFMIFLFSLTSSFASKAQLTKNNWLVGGTGSFYSYNQHYAYTNASIESEYTDIVLAASLGYFPFDKVAIGLRPAFHSQTGGYITSTGGVSGGRNNTKRYSVAPFARYYFLDTENPFNIIADASYQIGKVDFDGETGKMNCFSAMAGTVIFFNSVVGIEVLLGYLDKVEEIENNFRDKRKGFQASVGFQIHLKK